MPNPFDAIRKHADAIMQKQIDQPWIEREHEHFLTAAELKQRDTNNEASERTPTTLRGELEWARSANYGGDANLVNAPMNPASCGCIHTKAARIDRSCRG